MKNQITAEEKLKAEQAKHRSQLAENRQNLLDRKARTRRLIQHGAIADKLIDGAEKMSEREFEEALRKLLGESI